MVNRNLARSAAILSLAGLISKAIGALYRIPLFRLIGAEGMGLYQMAYPLYTLLLTVSSAGIPVAISKLVAERAVRKDNRGAYKILIVGLSLMLVVGLAGTGLLFISARFLAEQVLKDLRSYYSIIAIAPAIFFVALMSVFRGYFQGHSEMIPTAISQVVEQTVRVMVVLIGAYLFLPRGIEFAAAAATSGAVAGAVAGLATLSLCFSISKQKLNIQRREKALSAPKVGWQIVSLSVPISLGGLVLPMVQILDAVTVPLRLQQAGYTVSKSAELYGQLTGGANTLINVPTVFTLALATSLVPMVSELKVRQNLHAMRRYINIACKATLTICLPASLGLYLLAEPLASLLFDCSEAGQPLAVLAPAAVFLGLHQTTAGILQGLGKTHLPVKNLIVGVVIKLILNSQLTSMPAFGIKGAAIGTVAGFFASSILNCVDLYRIVGWRPSAHVLLKPAAAGTIMAIGVYFLFNLLKLNYGQELSALACVLAGALVYASVMALIDRSDDSIMGLLVRILEGRR